MPITTLQAWEMREVARGCSLLAQSLSHLPTARFERQWGMRRGMIGLLAIVGCTYHEPGLGDDNGVARTCPTDMSLLLCVDFDGALTPTVDGMNYVVASQNVVAADRSGDRAARVGATSQLFIDAGAAGDLAVPELTLEMWVAPDQRPASDHSYGIFDNSGQFGIELHSDGHLQATFGGQQVDGRTSVATQAWTHVALTYDGSSLQLLVNGAVDGCRSGSGGSGPTGNTAGVAIGANLSSSAVFADQFIGGLDNIWLFNRALSDAELCATAGQSGCNTTCPPPPS